MNAPVKHRASHVRLATVAMTPSHLDHPDHWCWPKPEDVRDEALAVCKQLVADGVTGPVFVYVYVQQCGDWGVTTERSWARLQAGYGEFAYDPDISDEAHDASETLEECRSVALDRWEEGGRT